MKISLITRHAVTNCGSLLQTMATQQIVEELGHTCEIIDYIRKDEEYIRSEITEVKRKPKYNNWIKKMVYLGLRLPTSIWVGMKFEKARKKYLNLSKRYRQIEQLNADIPNADIYMTGSDQVWGLVGNGVFDDAYGLAFTKEKDKRIAYAASFGQALLSKEQRWYYQELLTRYDQITVREDKAVEILKDMRINSTQVLDPTLLLDEVYWGKYTTHIKDDYILIYQVQNDKRVNEYAKKIAKEKGLKLIRISTSFHQVSRVGTFKWILNIERFLSYIKNAKCVVTNSFHGTTFAINFNVPFMTVLPNDNTESRNMSILKLTGLADRIVSDENLETLINETMDFSEANEILRGERAKSIAILKRMIED